MDLFHASRQWSERPNDERFGSLWELDDACYSYYKQAAVSTVPWNRLDVAPDGEEIVLQSASGKTATMTHWAFGQVTQRAGAPSAYLRALPAPLAADCLRHGLAKRNSDTASLMFHSNGGLVLRSATTESYTRIWNQDITSRLLTLVESDLSWRVPPARPARAGQPGARPATAADVLDDRHGLSVNIGDMIAPAGLYASDHDMFAFLINESARIDDGTDEGLSRGFFVWNSEVGAAAFGIMTFLYRHVCGNHIVWGAKDVAEIRIRHVGKAPEKAFTELGTDLLTYSEASAADDQLKIQRAQRLELGANKEAVLDRLFGIRSLALSRNTLEKAYDLAERQEIHINPRSPWGMAQGITRLSQDTPYADQRVALDRAAGKVLELAF